MFSERDFNFHWIFWQEHWREKTPAISVKNIHPMTPESSDEYSI